MRHPEYIEGREATENFEEGMKALFRVPKDTVAPMRKRVKTASSERKPRKGNKD